ncbi:hypothetical protein VN97_g6770 [Penicillium thymicola]|uniref:Uncharacterized protein n=1 Tax=Penicillium thymicola TaxID=293382 RepID=A0AAI9TGB4_PENTH|nr:hypothetical protein VN97_g6770 [Penicillium thymicola]
MEEKKKKKRIKSQWKQKCNTNICKVGVVELVNAIKSTELEIQKKRGAKELGPGNSVIRLRTQKNFPLLRFFSFLTYFNPLCLFSCKRRIEPTPPIASLIRVIAPNDILLPQQLRVDRATKALVITWG